MHVDIAKLNTALQCLPCFDHLASMGEGVGGYVVGGGVRDALIGLPVNDVDVIFPEDPTAMAQEFASRYGGHWFWLDKERRQSRVVFNRVPGCPDYDFSTFRAPSLGLDLLDRDFTINAIALPLSSDFQESSLVDPACGLADLRDGILRVVSEGAFASDPLRIVKGVRHATTLNLSVDAGTMRCMQDEVTGLHRIAVERIRQEVWKIIASDNVEYGLHLLGENLAGNFLFGSRYSCCIAALSECLRLFSGGWQRLEQCAPVVKEWLAFEVEQGLTYANLLSWFFMLSNLDRELPPRLAEEWLLSRKTRGYVEALTHLDDEMITEFHNVHKSERSFAWWAWQRRIDPKLLLLAIYADALLRNQDEFDHACAWIPVVDRLDGQPPKDFIDGHWLRSELGLLDGSEMTKALQLLRSAEINGRVDSTESAMEFLRAHYENID